MFNKSNLAKEKNDFSSYLKSFETMFILLTTCNFPDVMIKLMDESNLPIFFFIPYLIINTIFILALLKAVYYSNYCEILKKETAIFLHSFK